MQKIILNNGVRLLYKFKDKSSNIIYLNIILNTSAKNYSNMNKNDYSIIKRNNIEYYYIDDTFSQLLWYKHKTIYKLNGTLSKDELLKIAEGVEYN